MSFPKFGRNWSISHKVISIQSFGTFVSFENVPVTSQNVKSAKNWCCKSHTVKNYLSRRSKPTSNQLHRNWQLFDENDSGRSPVSHKSGTNDTGPISTMQWD